jgi:large conductance mechanosensitive channel
MALKAPKEVQKIRGEFREFLREYKIVALAIAFIMGAATNELIQSLVKNIIMPTITPFVPAGGWEEATLQVGPISWKWGAFLGSVIYFIIIAFVVFMIAKWALKEDKVTKK